MSKRIMTSRATGMEIQKGGYQAENLIISLVNKGNSISNSFLRGIYKAININFPLKHEDRAFCALPAGHKCGKTDVKLYNGGVLITNLQIKKGPSRILRKKETPFFSRKSGNQLHAGDYNVFTNTIGLSDKVSEMFRQLCKETRGFSVHTEVNQKNLIKEIESKKTKIGSFIVKGNDDNNIPNVHVLVNTTKESKTKLPKLKSYTIVNTNAFVKWLVTGLVEIVSGGIHIGRLRLQRKGGDKGEKSADRLQACFSIPELNTSSRDRIIDTIYRFI